MIQSGLPCLPGPGEGSLVPRNGSWLPGDKVKQRQTGSVACLPADQAAAGLGDGAGMNPPLQPAGDGPGPELTWQRKRNW